jgi:septal ring factor EnvC (AmiA/AmiB activator)
MASVERIGIAPVNFRGNDNKTQDVKTTDLKKYVTPTNVALGSLATLGVLGMADILICKGKHINKLTGKGKELEEALGRATSAETRAAEAEVRAAKVETLIADAKAEVQSLSAKLKGKLKEVEDLTSKIKDTTAAKNELFELLQRLHTGRLAVKDPKARQLIDNNLDDVMNALGYKFEVPPKDIKLAEHFNIEYGDIDVVRQAKPAIIDEATGAVLCLGHAFYPRSFIK